MRLRILLALLVMAASGSARAQDILIGNSTPATGAAAIAAVRERWGIDLAMSEINAAGGVLGRKLALAVEDNHCNPSEAVNVANKLIAEKVVAIIGAHCSSATIATMPLIAQAQIPMVGGVASSPVITGMSGAGANDWNFRTNPDDLVMMQALAAYLGEKKLFKRVAILAEDTDFGRGGVSAFLDPAKQAGIDIISTDFHPQGMPDFTSLLTRVSRSKPDAIALFQLGGDQLNLLRTAMQMGIQVPYTGRAVLGGENMQIIQANGMEGSISAWSYSAAIDAPTNQAFVKKIVALHQLEPVLQTWSGYDDMRMIAQAIKEAGSADPVKIRDALKKMTFQSVMGPMVKFDDHNQAGKIIVIQAIHGGKVTIADLVNLK